MNLQPVAFEDLPVGTPVPWPLYDRHGELLFQRGQAMNLPRPSGGLFRDLDDEAPRPPETSPAAEPFPPRGVKPQVWERMQLRRLEIATGARYQARLIGYIKDVSVLVTAPMLRGQRVILSEGEPLEVRMLTGQDICVFQTEIQRVCVNPAYYMHLAYPAAVRRQRLRASPWVRMNLLATVANADGERVAGFLTNLSVFGAQLAVSSAIAREGEKVRLTFQVDLDEIKRELSLDALVRHLRPTRMGEDGSEMLEYRVAFRELLAEQAIWLKCLVYKRIAEGYLI